MGREHGPFVCLDDSYLSRQQTTLAMEATGLNRDFSILTAPIYDLPAITTALSSALGPAGLAPFDVIFAFRALPADMSRHEVILRDWAALLTPDTGRLIVSCAPAWAGTPLQSAIQLVSTFTHEIFMYGSLVSDEEQQLLQSDFLDTFRAAGLAISDNQVLIRKAQARVSNDLAAMAESRFQE